MKDKIRILVVDDEEVIREMLREHLTDEGFDVSAVASGEEALEIFRRESGHIVVTDIRMPGMDGIQLLQEVKKVDEDAIVIMITSHASLDSAVETMRAGAYDYIFKPFHDLEQITQVVHRAVDQINLLRQNRALMDDLKESNIRMTQVNENLKEMASKDGLTGLYNHRHFKQVLHKEVTRADRYERFLTLIMVDVDHFKNYNDTHGHPMGDELLVMLSEIMVDRLRESDICARYGGEEFAILLPETDPGAAIKVAEDLRSRVDEAAFGNQETQPLGKVTVSMGVAVFPADASDESALLKVADERLYQAKEAGRNRVVGPGG